MNVPCPYRLWEAYLASPGRIGMSTAWLKRRLELERMMGVDALFASRGAAEELQRLEEEVRGCRL
jgi:hypothetical protein